MNFRDHIKEIASTLKTELKYYRLVLQDPRTPWLARILLGLAVAYAVSPIDIIPDFIPIIGHLDDFIIIPLLIIIAIHLIPSEVKIDCRKKVL